jgi:hypothetical protein
LKKIKLHLCDLAEEHHHCDARSFAHVFHRKNQICINTAFYRLPDTYQAGILLHELGHMALEEEGRHTEADADRMGYYLSGVPVRRRYFAGMKRLECVHSADLRQAKEFLLANIER